MFRLYFIHQHTLYLMNIDKWFCYKVIPSLVPYLKENNRLTSFPHSIEGKFLKHLYRLQKPKFQCEHYFKLFFFFFLPFPVE